MRIVLRANRVGAPTPVRRRQLTAYSLLRRKVDGLKLRDHAIAATSRVYE